MADEPTLPSEIQFRLKLLLPLFGVDLDAALHFLVPGADPQNKAAFHSADQLRSAGASVSTSTATTSVVAPVRIDLIPWDRSEAAANLAKERFPLDQLPNDFDSFENLGIFGLRAGPGGLGGFQTTTTIQTNAHARALLIIDLLHPPSDAHTSFKSDVWPFTAIFVDSLLDGLRFSSQREPHPYKGFSAIGDRLEEKIVKWPLAEIQGEPIVLRQADIEGAKEMLRQAWLARLYSRSVEGFRIAVLAMEYYYLSSTMTELRTIFLHLMIAFEALFKALEEESSNGAASRLAKLVASTKREYNEIRRFMFSTDQPQGCCQMRNEIVHGGLFSISWDSFWRLRRYLCLAIRLVLDLLLAGRIRGDAYYQSLANFANKRLETLPNR
jgi:hypothetical protein